MNLATPSEPPPRSGDTPVPHPGFELRFGSLFSEGRALSFPCDAAGRVELSRLSQRAQMNYRRALAVIGREYGMPSVCRRGPG